MAFVVLLDNLDTATEDLTRIVRSKVPLPASLLLPDSSKTLARK
jgi:hypothetical protein